MGLLLAGAPRTMVGQTPSSGGALFELDLGGARGGDIPANLRLLRGLLTVESRYGTPMLKASAASEFLIALPRVLPQAFTLEFELVPKACCNPQDLSFEGTAAINQGSASAHVLWDSDGYLGIIGGGVTYEAPMPGELRKTLPGRLTRVVVNFEGPTIKLYTNGRRMYTLDRQFARGRVLRVFLGGQDGGRQAVYLAGLRVLDGSGVVAQNQSALNPGRDGPVRVAPVGQDPPRSIAAPASRSFPLGGFVAEGLQYRVPPQRFAVPGFTGVGLNYSIPGRSISVAAFDATGTRPTVAPPTRAVGGLPGAATPRSIASRTIPLAGFTAKATPLSVSERTITVPGFAAQGVSTSRPARTVLLTGWTATSPE